MRAPARSQTNSRCIPGLGHVGCVCKIVTGFRFTEGPAVDGAGNLYFSDLHHGRGQIFRFDTTGKLDLFLRCSNKANGLKVNARGEILACETHTGRIVAHDPLGRYTRVVAACWDGRRFNAPNDLVIDKSGGIYFTDPMFDCPSLPFFPQRPAVYYIAPDGQVRRLVTEMRNPNGIVLSPDQSTLYLIASHRRKVMAYPVLSPGRLGEGRVFCRMAISRNPIYPGGDGAAVDCRGNLYIASQRGVQIYDPCGRRLAILSVPERPSNLVFGGPDGRTLYITAFTSIYAARMPIPGY